MSDKLRILITGFEPFPGAPYNPTQPLVARLTRLRRPALTDVELSGHIFPVTYRAVDRQLPELLARHRPQALLMFGLAGRTSWLRVETRARNAVTMLWPDADHTRVRKGSIVPDTKAFSSEVGTGSHSNQVYADCVDLSAVENASKQKTSASAMMFGPHTEKLLRAALNTGIDARASRDAGSYLCNYLSWRAIEAVNADNGPRLASFIHVPLLARDGAPQQKGSERITLDELVDAGEAMLLEMVKLTRSASRGSPERVKI